jgi:hypothetical protein
MTEPVYVYVLKRQERMGRIKTRQLRSVQQVMDELEKLGIDPKAARSRLLDLNGVESFRSPYYGLVTVEYPVEWVMPARMRENTMRNNPRYGAEPTFTIWHQDGTPYSRRPVDHTAMLDFLIFDAGMGTRGYDLVEDLVSGRRERAAFRLRGKSFYVTLSGKGGRGGGGASGAPARLNPKRNFFSGKKAQATWTVVLKDKRGNVVAHGEAAGENLVDVIKSLSGLGHFDAVALASYARSGDKPTMETRDEKGSVSVFPIPRSNPSRLPAIGETFGNYIVVGCVGKDRVKVLDWVAEKKGDGPSYYVMDAASFEGR